MTTCAQDILLALRSAIGGVRVQTRDEFSLLAELQVAAAAASADMRGGGAFPVVFSWSPIVGGLRYDATGVKPVGTMNGHKTEPDDVSPFFCALPDWVAKNTTAKDERGNVKYRPPAILCLAGCESELGEHADGSAVARRGLIEAVRIAKARGALLVLVGRGEKLSGDLVDELPVLKHGLPTRKQAAGPITDMLGAHRVALPPQEIDQIISAGQGLTITRQLDALGIALNRAALENRRVSPADILRFKEQEMAGGALQARAPRMTMEEILGYDKLKRWLDEARAAMSQEARRQGIPAPKGVLLAGPPGTGKSRLVEATASRWGVPWLTLDVGAVLSAYIGESEENMREALDTATRMSPCVVHLDEADTAFEARTGGGNDNDSGVARRCLGTFLRWLADKEDEVFVMMTSNHPDKLDPALIRKGRLDQIFFVDLPPAEQRAAIWTHYLDRGHIKYETEYLERLVRDSNGFSPAELESIVHEVRRRSFAAGKPSTQDDVFLELVGTVPQSKSMSAAVGAMRQWASEFAKPAQLMSPVVPPPAA